MRTIPKIVHYCWFGTGEKPADVQEYIKTWKKNMPDYEFMEWGESNFDIENAIPYVKEAYAARKFAFVSDYVRMQALYRYGGVYFDTDVEVCKPFEEYLEDRSMVVGFESKRSLLTAFVAVEKEHPFIGEFVDSYKDRHFLKEDGSYDMTVINQGFSELMEKKGVDLDNEDFRVIDGSIAVYPREYFCGFDVDNWHVRSTDKTCTIHHMASSWVGSKAGLKRRVINALQKTLGYDRYDKLKQMLRH